MNNRFDDYLAHHGVKGQKWGVRNYQNPDGTRIKKGKYESTKWKARDAKRLSDDELDRRNKRLQKENQYRQNVDNAHPVRKEVKAAAKKILLGTAVTVLAAAVKSKYEAGAGTFIGSKANDKIPVGSFTSVDGVRYHNYPAG